MVWGYEEGKQTNNSNAFSVLKFHLHQAGFLVGMNYDVDASEQANILILVVGKVVTSCLESSGSSCNQEIVGWHIVLEERDELGVLLLVH